MVLAFERRVHEIVKSKYWYRRMGGALYKSGDRGRMIEPRVLIWAGPDQTFLKSARGVSEGMWSWGSLAHTLKDRVDHLKGLIDLLADFRTCQDDLATDEDQEHDLGFDHAVDQAREQLRLVRAEVVMAGRKTLQADGELDVTGADDVLDLEIGELRVEAKLLDDSRILS